MPKVSIVIKTRNQRNYLKDSLPAIYSQTYRDFEVIVVDSGSTDGTAELVSQHDARLVPLASEQFGYARALNYGAKAAKGEYIVSLSGDAIPAREIWLQSLIQHFENPKVAGVYGRQLPKRDANLLERLKLYIRYPDHVVVQSKNHIFSNANSAFRKELFERYPFDETLIACEDYDWAKKMQSWDYIIIYEPLAEVYHSHPYSILVTLRRILFFRYLRFKIDYLRD